MSKLSTKQIILLCATLVVFVVFSFIVLQYMGLIEEFKSNKINSTKPAYRKTFKQLPIGDRWNAFDKNSSKNCCRKCATWYDPNGSRFSRCAKDCWVAGKRRPGSSCTKYIKDLLPT